MHKPISDVIDENTSFPQQGKDDEDMMKTKRRSRGWRAKSRSTWRTRGTQTRRRVRTRRGRRRNRQDEEGEREEKQQGDEEQQQ